MTITQEFLLVDAFESPEYLEVERGGSTWTFGVERPGVFFYENNRGTRIYFRPDWLEEGFVSVKRYDPGVGYSPVGEFSFDPGGEADDLFAIVEPYLVTRDRKSWNPRAEMSGRKDWDPRYEPLLESDLKSFLESYFETALWAENDPDTGEPLEREYTYADFDEDARRRLEDDAVAFLDKNWEDVQYEPGRAGHDFWLTRQGHGAGFWDGDWPEPAATRLTESAKEFGEVTLIVGDDGKIHAL